VRGDPCECQLSWLVHFRVIVQLKAMAHTTNSDQTSAVVPRRRDVYIALINLGCVYFLINVSYSGLETLQSTVNADQGLGTTSIGVLYAFLIVCSLLVGPTVVDRLRAKRTLYMAWSANAVFALANAFPRWETLVPASAFVGITMASGNIVYGLYVTGFAHELDHPNGQWSSFTSSLAAETDPFRNFLDSYGTCGNYADPASFRSLSILLLLLLNRT